MKNLIKKLIVLALPMALAMTPFATFAGVINVNTVYSTTGTKEATVYGSVNPGGVMTTAWFEYSEDMNFLNYSETNHIFVGSQGNEFPVRATIKNLKPDTIYYVRIVADNTQGTIRGNTILITTNPVINNQVVNIVNTNTTGTVASVNTKKVVETKIVYVNTNNLNNNSNYSNLNQNSNSNYYSNSNYNQSANALFGGDFLPNTFFGWLILLLIFFAILSILRRILFYY